jgi:hypothetical protein
MNCEEDRGIRVVRWGLIDGMKLGLIENCRDYLECFGGLAKVAVTRLPRTADVVEKVVKLTCKLVTPDVEWNVSEHIGDIKRIPTFVEVPPVVGFPEVNANAVLVRQDFSLVSKKFDLVRRFPDTVIAPVDQQRASAASAVQKCRRNNVFDAL